MAECIQRWHHMEQSDRHVISRRGEYTSEYLLPFHHHSLGQLIYAVQGVFTMITQQGRWIVPPSHAFWIPAGIDHAMQTHGYLNYRTLHIRQGHDTQLPTTLRVVGMTNLMRCLVEEAVKYSTDNEPTASSRAELVLALIRDEVCCLPEQPLGLPMPSDERLAALCRIFLDKPTPHATIDDWAKALATSRRAFTRLFRRETGLSLATWRQQACLFAALPRLAAGEPVTTIALDLGYDSVAAFTTMFRRILGAPPSRYMESHQP